MDLININAWFDNCDNEIIKSNRVNQGTNVILILFALKSKKKISFNSFVHSTVREIAESYFLNEMEFIKIIQETLLIICLKSHLKPILI